MAPAFDNRITRMLGIEVPIIQAPMGYIARSALASAVSNAGAMGIIETSSGRLDEIRVEIARMRDLTDRPFGVNIAQAFVSDPAMVVDFVIENGVRFVTTSAGSPAKHTPKLKDAGLTVFHVVPTLDAAKKAADAGVDGLIVEGVEGGGFKSPRGVGSMVLLPQVAEAVDLPIVAAGGIWDGASMAAAFALGAEGVQMGTAMVACAESPVHDAWKQAIINADATDTALLNTHASPALRALRSDKLNAAEFDREANLMSLFGNPAEFYFSDDLEAGIRLTGQVAGRIHEVKPVAEIIRSASAGCLEVIAALAQRYPQ